MSLVKLIHTTFHLRQSPGTGNAKVFNSNESVHLEGHELMILVEFCLKYNCTLTARLEYEEELWGEIFDNQTGNGLIGAIATRDANIAVTALYTWDIWYGYTQYSSIIQRAVATNIVPKPLPLPYWQTPILPFPGYIWSYILGAFLFGASALFIVNVSQSRIDNRVAGHVAFGLFDSIYAVFTMSIFQSVKIDINFLSNIIIFTAILIFALIIGNLYSGELYIVKRTHVHIFDYEVAMKLLLNFKSLFSMQ